MAHSRPRNKLAHTWVDQSEIRAEFQTVEDDDRVRQTDMLGTQIAMAIHDVTAQRPLPKAGTAVQESRLDTREKHLHLEFAGQKFRTQQDRPIYLGFVRKMPKGLFGIDRG